MDVGDLLLEIAGRLRHRRHCYQALVRPWRAPRGKYREFFPTADEAARRATELATAIEAGRWTPRLAAEAPHR